MKFLRSILLNNIAIKIISLILALFTWSYIGGQLYRKTVAKDGEAPSIMKVSGEELIVKSLPIYVNIEGEPADGYRIVLDRILISPTHSVVAGAQESLKELSYIATKPVSINGANSNVRKNVKLKAIPNCKIGYEGLVRITIPITRVKRR